MLHRHHFAVLALALFPACKAPATPSDQPTRAATTPQATEHPATESEHPTALPTTEAALPKDLTPLHEAVIAGDPDAAFSLRRGGEDPNVAFAGLTALDLAFAAWDRASDPDNWTPGPDTTPEQVAMLDACPFDLELLEAVIEALIHELPVNAESTKLIDAWFAAAAAGDIATAQKLGTPAWVKEETTWKASFSRAVFKDGVRFDSYEITGAETESDLTTVTVQAALIRPDGTTDGEQMTFKLKQFEKELLIVELR